RPVLLVLEADLQPYRKSEFEPRGAQFSESSSILTRQDIPSTVGKIWMQNKDDTQRADEIKRIRLIADEAGVVFRSSFGIASLDEELRALPPRVWSPPPKPTEGKNHGNGHKRSVEPAVPDVLIVPAEDSLRLLAGKLLTATERIAALEVLLERSNRSKVTLERKLLTEKAQSLAAKQVLKRILAVTATIKPYELE
ncbi:MAG: hypothetical protein KW802_03530, partial [Candidatus Doudnabacteria bacterium]|nr:hypothetical protein [Candidatus Doudnabacteria bacterium]